MPESSGAGRRQSSSISAQGILGALVGEVQVDHGGGDLLVTEQRLDGVQAGAGLHQWVAKDCGAACATVAAGRFEFLAGDDHEPLQRADGHGRGGRAHALAPVAPAIDDRARHWERAASGWRWKLQ